MSHDDGNSNKVKRSKAKDGERDKSRTKPWKRNNHCLTLELKPGSHFRDRLGIVPNYKIPNVHESTFIRTRRDRSQFLIYCCNCFEPGHTSGKCNNRYKISVIGDSHTAVWGRALHFYVNSHVIRCRIAGMSAQGLTNKESQLQSAQKICKTLNKCHSGNTQFIFIQIGQVDVDFVWYYRQINYILKQQNESKDNKNDNTNDNTNDNANDNDNDNINKQEEKPSFKDQIERSTDRLFDFLENVLLKQDLPLFRPVNNNGDGDNEMKQENSNDVREKIIIHGIHLPPLNTKQMKIVLQKHFIERSKMDKTIAESFFHQENKENINDNDCSIGIIPSHVERTQMAFDFNRVLKEKAIKFGYRYVDVCNEIYDKQSGTVKNEYIKTECDTDIHLNPDKLVPIYHSKFKQMQLPFATEIEHNFELLNKFELSLQNRFRY